MTSPSFAAVILAAGQGKRMKSALPKALLAVTRRPMIEHVLAAVRALGPGRIVVVLAPGTEQLFALPPDVAVVVQKEPRGTGDAVRAARGALKDFRGDVLLLYGDTPLVTSASIAALLDERRRAPEPAIVVAGMRLADGGGYGRLVTAGDGGLDAIIEARDCSDAQRRIGFCNAGPMVVDGGKLFGLLEAIGSDNDQGEYYLTAIVAAARRQGLACRAVEVPAEEMAGANDRAELAQIEALMQKRLRDAALAAGVTMIAPETVFLAADTRIGRDSVIGSYVVFGPGVTVGESVEIVGFCHIEGARIGDHSRVGPFARLRPGADLAEEVHIGNFVEVKETRLGPGAKANHLAYLGDASVGARTNIGAGTITCNYDGIDKHRTEIGADVFVGTNSSLVAPVTVGDGAMIAAGSVVTDTVPKDALALGRAHQTTKPGGAKAWREKRRTEGAATRKK
jgi:bifunctional UDP-N-acetylglucosamine pyrophosphorylase / glucosamine-1-phosphate N-acetyltransferase